jgi:alkylhydroperoxidase family enzyme
MVRLPYLDLDDVPEAYRDSMRPTNPFLKPATSSKGESPWQTLRNTHRVLAHNPPLLAAYRRYAAELWTATGLTDRQRELVILGCARGRDSAYEWHQHVLIALDGLLSRDEILAIAQRDLGRLSEADRALVQYALSFADGTVDDSVYRAVAAHLDEATLLGASLLLAYYVGIDFMGEALALDLEEPFVGWDLENV